MTTSFTVLTVCTGNVHRSALADVLLATWAQWYLPPGLRDGVVVGSAGTRAPAGEPMGSTTRRIAASLGADGTVHRARTLTEPLIRSADLVLAASVAHRDEIVRRVPRAMHRTFTIREAARLAAPLLPGAPRSLDDLTAVVERLADERARAAASIPSVDDIVDPHRKDVTVMDDMVREEVPALVDIAVALWGMPRGDADEYRRAAADPASLR